MDTLTACERAGSGAQDEQRESRILEALHTPADFKTGGTLSQTILLSNSATAGFTSHNQEGRRGA